MTAAAAGHRGRLAIALAVVFAVKLAVLLQLHDHPLLQPEAGLDTTVYVELAREVMAGNLALGPGLYFVSPLYIYFLAFVLSIASGSLFALRLAQIALGTLAVWLIYRTARLWHGPRAAWIAAALAASTGLFTFYEVLLLQVALDPILTAAALACLASALAREHRASIRVCAHRRMRGRRREYGERTLPLLPPA